MDPSSSATKEAAAMQVADHHETVDYEMTENSRTAAQREHDLTIRQALSQHKSAVFWAAWFILPNCVIGYDATTLGTLVGIPQFRKEFGYEYPAGSGSYVLSPSWTAAFPYAPIIGFILGPAWAGWCIDRFGPRKTLLACTSLSMATLLIQIFAKTAAVIFTGALLTGILTGSFPALGPAYISEILPVRLRGIGLAANNLAQVVGSFIAIGVLTGTSTLKDQWAYRIPFITEYAFPLCFTVAGLFAPETPWFLVKKTRYEEAARSLERTGYGSDLAITLAHMKETILLEREREVSSTYLDCFKGVNFRRTAISTVCYCGQFFSGINVASSYATYFFQLAGVTTQQAFHLSLGLFALGIVGNLISWPLLSVWGRRFGYISTCCATTALMFIVGFLDLAPESNKSATYAKSSMLLVFYLVYNCGLGPLTYAIMAEVPNTTIRGKTLGVACSLSHIISLAITAGLPYAMSPTEANWGGKIGFLFGGLGVLLACWAVYYLPETKNKTFAELDILFEHKIPAWRFSTTAVSDIEGVEIVGGQKAVE